MTAATEVATPAPKPLLLKIERLHNSPTNPRRHFNERKLEEMAASIRSHGILQPVQARPHPTLKGEHELIFGERRKRAAELAGLEVIPALVVDMDDETVAEVQTIENTQREDVHPLDEAEGYKRLLDKHRYTAERIADRVGRSTSYIHKRLQLTQLIDAAKKKFFDDGIDVTLALILARIPAKLQPDALKKMTSGNEGPMTTRQARDLAHREFMLVLGDAPFDTKDAQLVPAAGACTTCPKRSGNQRALFDDIKSADVCTDIVCHRAKGDAAWKARAAKAEESGLVVLGKKEAEKVFNKYRPGELEHNSKFVELNSKRWGLNYSKEYSVKTVVGKDAPIILARDLEGGTHELVERAVFDKAVAALEKTSKKEDKKRATSSGPSQETLLRKKLELRKKVIAAATPLIFAAAKEQGQKVLQRIVIDKLAQLEHLSGGGIVKQIAILLGAKMIEGQPFPGEEALEFIEAAMAAGDLPAVLILAGILPNAAGSTWSTTYNVGFSEACKELGVDLKKIESQAKDEEKEKAGAKKEKKKPAPCCSPGCKEPREGAMFCAEHRAPKKGKK